MHCFYNKCRTNLTSNYLIIMSHLIQKHPYTECVRGTVERGIKNKQKIKTEDKRRIRQEFKGRNSSEQLPDYMGGKKSLHASANI